MYVIYPKHISVIHRIGDSENFKTAFTNSLTGTTIDKTLNILQTIQHINNEPGRSSR